MLAAVDEMLREFDGLKVKLTNDMPNSASIWADVESLETARVKIVSACRQPFIDDEILVHMYSFEVAMNCIQCSYNEFIDNMAAFGNLKL